MNTAYLSLDTACYVPALVTCAVLCVCQLHIDGTRQSKNPNPIIWGGCFILKTDGEGEKPDPCVCVWILGRWSGLVIAYL